MTNIIDLSSFLDVGKKIEDLVYEFDIDYIDACLLYCEQNKIEVEFFADLIEKDNYIKTRLQQEAEDLNFLKKQVRLPI